MNMTRVEERFKVTSTRKDAALSGCKMLLALILLAAKPEPAHSWQGGPVTLARLRSKVMPHKRIQRQSAGLFPSRSRPSHLFEQINGSASSSKTKSSDVDEKQTQRQSRRSRVRTRMSNLWASIFHPDTPNAESKLEAASMSTQPPAEEIVEELETENKLLRETIRQLEAENERLSSQRKVVLETFEGEGRLKQIYANSTFTAEEMMNHGITLTGDELTGDIKFAEGDETLWCDDLDEDSCPVEPTVSFGSALRDRAYWLVGLLIMQSCSGLILSRNEALLSNHPIIIYFLTMLVGAGGNAGNQASVRVIRGIALGTLNENTQGQFLTRELKMAGALSAILSCAGFLRAAAFRTPFPETVAVTASLSLIVFSSICLGAILPLFLQKLGVDPAHSSTTIQVVMDILGVFVAVIISSLILDSPLGGILIQKLGG